MQRERAGWYLRAAGAPLLLFAINAFVCWRLFRTEYLDQLGSIEAAFIALPRYILDNWRDLSWFPLWYGGIPFQNTYPPLLHLTVAAFAGLTGWSAASAYHAVTAALYCAGPVALFWLARRISGAYWTSLAAALLYSLFSPSALLMPAIRADAGGLFHARRLQALVGYGESPHIASLALLPIAVLCLDTAIRRRRPGWHLLAALSMAAVVLTNWFGGATLGAAVVAYLLARRDDRLRGWVVAIALGACAYVLAAPWIPPSTLLVIRRNAEWSGGSFPVTAWNLLYVAAMAAAVLGLNRLLDRLKAGLTVRFAAGLAVFTTVVPLASEWLRIVILPQPQRYHLDMELALALLAAFSLRPLLVRAGRRWRMAATAALAIFCAAQIVTYRKHARSMIRPIDLTRTFEYQAAAWLRDHANGNRVLSAGSSGWWLNYLADTQQLAGGFDLGITNPVLPHALYQIYSGYAAGNREADIAEQWLRAYGVSMVLVPGLHGRAFYKDYWNPRKYEGRFQEVWREGDDSIWRIPSRSYSLAHVVRPEDLPKSTPRVATDVEPLRAYVAALENPALPVATMRWSSRHSAVIQTDLRAGQLLSVQIAYHPGWRVSARGRWVRPEKDHLNQLVVDPGCQGPCVVELTYDGGLEMWVARILSWWMVAAGLVWVAVDSRRLISRAPAWRRR